MKIAGLNVEFVEGGICEECTFHSMEYSCTVLDFSPSCHNGNYKLIDLPTTVDTVYVIQYPDGTYEGHDAFSVEDISYAKEHSSVQDAEECWDYWKDEIKKDCGATSCKIIEVVCTQRTVKECK